MATSHRTSVWRPLACSIGVLALSPQPLRACDLHGLGIASVIRDDTPGLHVGVAGQWTRYTTLQDGDDEIPNPADERLESSITNLVAGYRFHERFAAELRLPVITRSFRRVSHEGRVEHDDESGIGDLMLLADVLALRRDTPGSELHLSLLGGLELPTGDSGRLREEREHGHDDGGDEHHAASGIHGHDLALGSGSVDGIVGADLFWSWRRVFLGATVLYAIRTEGDFDFEYADDLQWSAGPGVLAWRGRDAQVAVQALVSGDTKGQDELDGRRLHDTAATTVYAGPAVHAVWKSLTAGAALDVPVVTNRTGLQIAPDLRVRGDVRWRF